MRRLAALAMILLLSSCKTSSRSGVNTAYWARGEQLILIYPKDGRFLINTCQKNPELKVKLEKKKNLMEAIEICHDEVKPIEKQALEAAIIQEIASSNVGDIQGRKVERIAELKSTLDDLNKLLVQIIGLNDGNEGPTIRDLNEQISRYTAEINQLSEAAKDPDKLKQIDIASTLALQSKLYNNATDQAGLMIEMLADKTVYTLDENRDVVLIRAIDHFTPVCDQMAANEVKDEQLGIETIHYRCNKDGSITFLDTTCTFPGYERVRNSSCLFKGNLSVNTLSAAHEGVCALNKENKLSCWGKLGRFPMIDAISVTNLSQGMMSQTKSLQLVSSSNQLCVLENMAVRDCLPRGMQNIPKDKTFKSIIGGDSHFCGITSDEKVECWGQNNLGQLKVPADLGDVKHLSTTENVSCAIDGSGTIKCWGEYYDTSFNANSIPPGAQKSIAVTVGSGHACSLRSDGKVLCWGELKHGKTLVPPDLTASRMIVAARHETCSISQKGDELWCWGGENVAVPYSRAPALQNVKTIIPSRWGGNLCAIYGPESSVACWGVGHYDENYDITPPPGLKDVTDIVITSSGYACAKLKDNTSRCWGNKSGIQESLTH